VEKGDNAEACALRNSQHELRRNELREIFSADNGVFFGRWSSRKVVTSTCPPARSLMGRPLPEWRTSGRCCACLHDLLAFPR
jgi:hypothetical protein